MSQFGAKELHNFNNSIIDINGIDPTMSRIDQDVIFRGDSSMINTSRRFIATSMTRGIDRDVIFCDGIFGYDKSYVRQVVSLQNRLASVRRQLNKNLNKSDRKRLRLKYKRLYKRLWIMT